MTNANENGWWLVTGNTEELLDGIETEEAAVVEGKKIALDTFWDRGEAWLLDTWTVEYRDADGERVGFVTGFEVEIPADR